MAIISKDKYTRPRIDLTGPDGNAMCLMGYAKQYARQLGLDFEPILKDMMSSDYEHVVQVFDEHFGDYVDLIR